MGEHIFRGPKLFGGRRFCHFLWESHFSPTCLTARLSDSSLSNYSPLHRSEGLATEWKGFAGMVNDLPVKQNHGLWTET